LVSPRVRIAAVSMVRLHGHGAAGGENRGPRLLPMLAPAYLGVQTMS